jgi:hypothetical protein
MPAFEVVSQLMIEHMGPDLQEPMRALRCPPHLLLLDEPFADDLVDSRLDKASRDRLAVPVTISVIRDRLYVGGYVVLNSSSLSCKAVARGVSVPISQVKSSSVRRARCGLPCHR